MARLSLRLCSVLPWSSCQWRRDAWLLSAPRALHLPGIPDTCALRIVPASSAFHRCSSREGPTTVLRASGIKAAPGQEFLPSKCSVYRCSCEALASPHTDPHTCHLCFLEPGRGSPRGICIFSWNSSKLPKPAAWKKKALMRCFQPWWPRGRTIMSPTSSPCGVSPRKCLKLILKWPIGNGFRAEF